MWYNGDSQGVSTNARFNFESTNLGSANIHDDFVVDRRWIVNRVWSNNSTEGTGINQTSRAIRSGVSTGNCGTLIASGTAATTQTVTGRRGIPHPSEYRIEVVGPNVALAASWYFPALSRVVGNAGSGACASCNTGTLKDNAIEDSAVNNDNSFLFRTAKGTNFAPLSLDNFMGAAGKPVPGACEVAVLADGLVAMVPVSRNKRKR